MPPAWGQRADAERLLDQARIHQAAGASSEALTCLQEYVTDRGRSSDAYRRALQFCVRHRLERARLPFLREAVTRFPGQHDFLERLAGFQTSRAEYEEAAQTWEILVDTSTTARGVVRASRRLATLRGLRDAFDCLWQRREAFAQAPTYRRQVERFARAVGATGVVAEWIIARARQCREIEPLLAETDRLRSLIDKDPNGAKRQLMQRALEKTPQALCVRAVLLNADGRSEEAWHLLTSLAPQSAWIRAQQARFLEHDQDWEEAAIIWISLLESPEVNRVSMIRRIVRAYRKADDWEQVRLWFGKWKEAAPSSREPWIAEAAWFKRHGEWRWSEEVYQTHWHLYQYSNTWTEKRERISELIRIARQRDLIRLLKDFERECRREPVDASAWLALAEFHEQTGNEEGRREALSKAEHVDSLSLPVLHEQARLMKDQGNWESALTLLRKAVASDPSSESKVLLINLLADLSRYDEALAYTISVQSDQRSVDVSSALLSAALALARSNDWPAVAAFLRPHHMAAPDDLQLACLFGIALEYSWQSAEALEVFCQLLENEAELADGEIPWPRQGSDFMLPRTARQIKSLDFVQYGEWNWWSKLSRIPLWHRLLPHVATVIEGAPPEMIGYHRALLDSLYFDDLDILFEAGRRQASIKDLCARFPDERSILPLIPHPQGANYYNQLWDAYAESDPQYVAYASVSAILESPDERLPRFSQLLQQISEPPPALLGRLFEESVSISYRRNMPMDLLGELAGVVSAWEGHPSAEAYDNFFIRFYAVCARMDLLSRRLDTLYQRKQREQLPSSPPIAFSLDRLQNPVEGWRNLNPNAFIRTLNTPTNAVISKLANLNQLILDLDASTIVEGFYPRFSPLTRVSFFSSHPQTPDAALETLFRLRVADLTQADECLIFTKLIESFPQKLDARHAAFVRARTLTDDPALLQLADMGLVSMALEHPEEPDFVHAGRAAALRLAQVRPFRNGVLLEALRVALAQFGEDEAAAMLEVGWVPPMSSEGEQREKENRKLRRSYAVAKARIPVRQSQDRPSRNREEGIYREWVRLQSRAASDLVRERHGRPVDVNFTKEELLKRLLEVDPTSPWEQARLALMAKALGDHEREGQLLKQAHAAEPKRRRLRSLLDDYLLRREPEHLWALMDAEPTHPFDFLRLSDALAEALTQTESFEIKQQRFETLVDRARTLQASGERIPWLATVSEAMPVNGWEENGIGFPPTRNDRLYPEYIPYEESPPFIRSRDVEGGEGLRNQEAKALFRRFQARLREAHMLLLAEPYHFEDTFARCVTYGFLEGVELAEVAVSLLARPEASRLEVYGPIYRELRTDTILRDNWKWIAERALPELRRKASRHVWTKLDDEADLRLGGIEAIQATSYQVDGDIFLEIWEESGLPEIPTDLLLKRRFGFLVNYLSILAENKSPQAAMDALKKWAAYSLNATTVTLDSVATEAVNDPQNKEGSGLRNLLKTLACHPLLYHPCREWGHSLGLEWGAVTVRSPRRQPLMGWKAFIENGPWRGRSLAEFDPHANETGHSILWRELMMTDNDFLRVYLTTPRLPDFGSGLLAAMVEGRQALYLAQFREELAVIPQDYRPFYRRLLTLDQTEGIQDTVSDLLSLIE